MTVVDDFMTNLDHPLKAEVEAVRAIILGADDRINEGIKWNAPSFYIGDHFATFNLRPLDKVQVVLHTGAKAKADATAVVVSDPLGILKWITDARCVASFSDMADINAKRDAFTLIIQEWIEQL